MVRIFFADNGLHLLVIQHLRRHLKLPPAKEFLIWCPYANNTFVDDFMQMVIPDAQFADTLDIREFASLKPRTQGPLAWLVESTKRLRRDAATLRSWMEKNRIDECDAELWADDPIHIHTIFLRCLLRKSRHVKIPHCFNFEDITTPKFKEYFERQWHKRTRQRRFLFLPWQRWTSGVDLRMERVVYDRAYTFDLPSPWAARSIDVSGTISIDAFTKTYNTLPDQMRAEVESILRPIRAARRPIVLLLLFGLDPELRGAYEKSVSRIFKEKAAELKNCSLVVKVFPGQSGGSDENILINWLQSNVSAQVFSISHVLTLEFMLPQLRPNYVWAGPCGAMPIIRRLGIARPVVLREVTEHFCRIVPAELDWSPAFLQGMEVW